MRENIAVIFGGRSVEHDISIITGLQVLNNLSNKYNVLPLYIDSNGQMCMADNLSDVYTYLDFDRKVKNKKTVSFRLGEPYIFLEKRFQSKIKLGAAILCTHGKNGEDGSLQGLLELCKIPYTSPRVLASSLCMDKACAKYMMLARNLPTPKFVDFYSAQYNQDKDKILSQIETELRKFPVIVKPASLGSSVGISVCKTRASLMRAIDNALLFDEKVIVEEFIEGAKEYCCAGLRLGNQVVYSDVVEVKKGEIFTFEDKYLRQNQENIQNIEDKLRKEIEKLTIDTYTALECDGVVRVDFLLGEELYVNELNTIPGSLAFNLFHVPFSDLLDSLILEAQERFRQNDRHMYEFSSGAIEQYAKISRLNKYSK